MSTRDQLENYKVLVSALSNYNQAVICDDGLLIPAPDKQSEDPYCGCLPWAALELGNGDTGAFYWKITEEDKNPIIVACHHDEGRFIPWASDLELFLKLCLNMDELNALQDFWFDKEALEDMAGGSLEYLRHRQPIKTIDDALKLCPDSPFLLKLKADEYYEQDKLSLAEHLYKRCLEVLPEYGDCSYKLGMLYRNQRKTEHAITFLISAFNSSVYFSCIELKCKILNILSRFDDIEFQNKDDPLWKRRKSLNIDDGEKKPTFHIIINEMIEEYIDRKEFHYAYGLRSLLGAFAWQDEGLTHRYRARQHRELLEHDLKLCNLERRIPIEIPLQISSSNIGSKKELNKKYWLWSV